MPAVPVHLAHCGGPAREAVPDGDGRWRFRCEGCDKEFVVVEEAEVPEPPLCEAQGLVQVEPTDPFPDASPAERLRALLGIAYGTTDRLRAIETLCRSWYVELSEAEDDTMHRVNDLFVAGDHVYVTLEFGEGEVRFDERGILVSEPTLVCAWTLVWGPGTRFVGELEARLVERFGSIAPPASDDLGGFCPVLAWWSPSLWLVGYSAAITSAIDEAQIGTAVRETRRLARRVASLAINPESSASPPTDEG